MIARKKLREKERLIWRGKMVNVIVRKKLRENVYRGKTAHLSGCGEKKYMLCKMLWMKKKCILLGVLGRRKKANV